MFKRIKENEKVQKIVKLWKNPKTHDIIVLAFWLLFIFIVIIFARVTTTSSASNLEVNNSPGIDYFSSMRSYDFRYKTNDLEISGRAYNDALIFYMNNKQYYYRNAVYLIDENPIIQANFDLNILKINSKMLDALVSGLTPSDNGSFKQYIVPLDRFINLYEIDTDADLSKAATYNVVVSAYLTDNVISKVVLDLSNYYALKNGVNTSYPVTIYYYNVNNVSDFRKEYDKVVEVIK